MLRVHRSAGRRAVRELEQRLNSAEKYSPKSDTWARIANTHCHHSDADAAALDGNYIKFETLENSPLVNITVRKNCSPTM
jgi:Kelch motif